MSMPSPRSTSFEALAHQRLVVGERDAGGHQLSGSRDVQRHAALRGARDVEAAADQRQPLAHAGESESFAQRHDAAAIVAHSQANYVAVASQLHPGIVAPRVTHDIGQRFLHHAQQRLGLRHVVDARVVVDLQVNLRRCGSGAISCASAWRISRPSCWRICATTPRMSSSNSVASCVPR